MNVEEIASWVLYNSDHYVVGCVGDVPRRSGTFCKRAVYSPYKSQ